MPDQETLPTELPLSVVNRFRLSGLAQLLFFYTGMVMPVISFLFGYPSLGGKTGEAATYAQLFLSHKGSLPFFPFVFYSIVSMGLLIYYPDRFVKNAFVRFGIHSGVVVAIGFFCLFCMTFYSKSNSKLWDSYLLWAGLGTLGPGIFLFFLSRYKWFQVFICFLVFASTIFFPIIIGITFFFATPWAVASYAVMSFRIIRHRKGEGLQFSLAQLLGVVTWFGCYCAAWRVAYMFVLEEYQNLPSSSPSGCYLCTAAAHGHQRFVKSEDYTVANGATHRVNDQLRCFKAFELLLLAICPWLHRLCRRIYDGVGPAMAKTIEYPLLADVTYAALKPAEWLCRAAILAIVRDGERWFHLYSNHPVEKTRMPAK
jgi:hypothetical protein